MFQNKAIHKQALWCFFLFLVLSKFSFSQSTNDSLIFQLPESQSWDNPLDEPSSGFYLSTPTNLQGAIIVITRENGLPNYIETGTRTRTYEKVVASLGDLVLDA